MSSSETVHRLPLVSHIPPHWRAARGPFGMMLRTWDTLTGEPGMTLVPLLGERISPEGPRRSAWFAVSPDGQVHGSANVEQELVYVVQTDKRNEKEDAYAIDQTGDRPTNTEIRLYVFPDETTSDLHVVLIGDKPSQKRDVNEVHDFIRDIKKKREEHKS